MWKASDFQQFFLSFNSTTMSLRLSIFVLFAASLLATSYSTTVQQCLSKAPMPLSVDIENCVEPPCIVYKNSNATMLMHFVATKDVSALTAKANAFVFGTRPTSYALQDSIANVCNNLLDGAYCPLYEMEDVVYNFKLEVESWFPQISTRVEINLEDDNGTVISCFRVSIKVRSQSAKN